ncbi:MAG: SLBB domain-containing protein, partial [Terriglobales bacterium]
PPPCLEDDCAYVPKLTEDMANPTPGKTGAQTLPGTQAEPNHAPGNNAGQNDNHNKNGNQNNNDEREPGTEPAGRRKRAAPPRAEEIPEPPPTEFQEFVASSIGRRLPVYGSSLFAGVPTTFAPVDRIPVTGDYRIGPGDEILIRAWGQIDLNAKLVVDRGGEVFLPKVGALSVAGLQYQQLPEYLRTAIGRVFRNFDLTVSLGQLRSIQVFVVGQARRPGSYTVSSLCTLVNALFASGGPANGGSMRHIQLKRDNRAVTDFDLYDLLLQGDKSKDARLLPGDVIYIPPAGPAIAVAGSVNVPAIYELREATSLQRAIEMAGGLATTADGQKAVVERIENRSTRRVEEFPLDGQGLERTLQDGDVVRIFSLSPHFENAVTLRGNVAHPGRLAWHPGMHLKDAIPNQDALVTRDYWRATNSVANADERGNQRFERLPARTKPLNGTTAADLRNQITRDAPEINWDYAVIQRLNPLDLATRLIPFDLGKLVLQGDEHNNMALEPGDVITIFSQNDLAVPLEKQSKFVRLEGEFRAAGVYRAEAGETIRQLVERAGGLTSNAYLYGAEFTRESVRLDQQKGLDRMIDTLEEDIAHNALAPAGVSPEEVADERAKLEAQRQLVNKLREVRATGRVVLDLTPNSGGVGGLPEIPLEDGDRFVVPYRPSTVEILGAVYNKNSFLYRRDGRVDDYLKRAGGATRDADSSRMFVIRADGSVLSRQSVKGLWNGGFASLRLMPGDAIIVPERLSHGSFLKGLRDWSQIFSQFALGAAAVRVIQ